MAVKSLYVLFTGREVNMDKVTRSLHLDSYGIYDLQFWNFKGKFQPVKKKAGTILGEKTLADRYLAYSVLSCNMQLRLGDKRGKDTKS